MYWIDYELEKPTESDYYFVKGKGGRKAIIHYWIDTGWEIPNSLASNHFNDSTICWLKEE
jgi:hypothetical protein